jgi:hypothetical protein
MVIFGLTNPDDLDSRYDIVDDPDLLTAVDQIEVFCKVLTKTLTKPKKMALKLRTKTV